MSGQILLTGSEILHRTRVLSSQLNSYFDNEPQRPTYLTVLRGAERFSRALRAQSKDDHATCRVATRDPLGALLPLSIVTLPHLIPGRPVIIVEDIVDTGRTLNMLVSTLRSRGVTQIHLVSLFVREGLPTTLFLDLGLSTVAFGFVVPKDLYIYGFGLDYDVPSSRYLQDVFAVQGVGV